MKKKANKQMSILFAILICISLSLPAFASKKDSVPNNTGRVQVSAMQNTQERIPENKELSREEITDESPAAYDKMEEEVTQEQPVIKKSSNKSLYIGALISVFCFIGVIIFCKVKGNR